MGVGRGKRGVGQRGGGDEEVGNGEGETGMGKRAGVDVLARVGSMEGGGRDVEG